jgi:hypothetical protein
MGSNHLTAPHPAASGAICRAPVHAARELLSRANAMAFCAFQLAGKWRVSGKFEAGLAKNWQANGRNTIVSTNGKPAPDGAGFMRDWTDQSPLPLIMRR